MITLALCQDIYTDYLIEAGDTIDVFSYQIPESYDANNSHPLLIAFHQWGGNENSNYYTEFDEEANSRGWIMLSPYGGSANNYNHQGAQAMVEDEILWLMNNFNIDSKKISTIPNGFDKSLFFEMDKESSRIKLNLPTNKKKL